MDSNFVGLYAQYKDSIFLVAEEVSESRIRLINPSLKGSNKNKVVSIVKVKLFRNAAIKVTYDNSDYLVTAKNNIVSLRTHKVMAWGKEHGHRVNILKSADNNHHFMMQDYLQQLQAAGQPLVTVPKRTDRVKLIPADVNKDDAAFEQLEIKRDQFQMDLAAREPYKSHRPLMTDAQCAATAGWKVPGVNSPK